jgi:hypothetical protein
VTGDQLLIMDAALVGLLGFLGWAIWKGARKK